MQVAAPTIRTDPEEPWFPESAADARVVTGPVPTRMRHGVAILGSFDGVHRGHRRLMDLADELAAGMNCPVVALSAEPHPVTFFGRGPQRFRLTCPRTKVGLLAHYGADFVYSPAFDARFAAMSPDQFVLRVLAEALGARHIVVGDDFHFGARRAGNVAVLSGLAAAHAIPVSVIPEVLVDGLRCSSSNIRTFIGQGEMRRAARMLGYAWHFLAKASRHGSATWALDPSPELIEPAGGVYEVQARMRGEAGVAGRLFVEGGRMIFEARHAAAGFRAAEVLIEMPFDRR